MGNWAPYYFRCEFEPNSFPTSPCLNLMYTKSSTRKNFLYSHIFKAGGTTIINGMGKYFANKSEYGDPQYEECGLNHYRASEFLKIMESMNANAMMNIFTFARHPISKYLSAFLEVNKRYFDSKWYPVYSSKKRIKLLKMLNITWLQYTKMTPLNILRMTLDKQLESGDFIDEHYAPNAYFLNAMRINFNFIGHLQSLNNDLPQILSDGEIDSDEFMKKYCAKQRHGTDAEWTTFDLRQIIERFHLNISQLSAKDISDICELYWMDFMSLPFELPKECDIDQLIKKHYGKDIVYKSCYTDSLFAIKSNPESTEQSKKIPNDKKNDPKTTKEKKKGNAKKWGPIDERNQRINIQKMTIDHMRNLYKFKNQIPTLSEVRERQRQGNSKDKSFNQFLNRIKKGN